MKEQRNPCAPATSSRPDASKALATHLPRRCCASPAFTCMPCCASRLPSRFSSRIDLRQPGRIPGRNNRVHGDHFKGPRAIRRLSDPLGDFMNEAIRILRDEHRSISSVLHGLRELARIAQDPAVRPDFSVFRAMIYYIDWFPERLHHPKENDVLFPRLLMRLPSAAPLVQQLRDE